MPAHEKDENQLVLDSWHKTDTMSFLWCYLPAAPLYVTCGIMTNHLSLTSYLKIKIPYYAAPEKNALSKNTAFILLQGIKSGIGSSSVVLFTKVQWTHFIYSCWLIMKMIFTASACYCTFCSAKIKFVGIYSYFFTSILRIWQQHSSILMSECSRKGNHNFQSIYGSKTKIGIFEWQKQYIW